MGKGRVLTVKEINISIAKLLKKREDKEAAAVRKAEYTEKANHGMLPKPHKKPYIKRHVMQHSLLDCLDSTA